MFGWDAGMISGFVSHSKDEYYLSNVRVGLIVSIFSIGDAVGALVLSKLGGVYGRCMGLMAAVLVYVVGIVFQILSDEKWYQCFIERIVAGLGGGGVGVLAHMLIFETAPKHLRGALLAGWQLMVNCANHGTKNYSNSIQ